MKPVIGVLPLWDDEKESIWMLPGYFDGITEAGGIPVMLPLISSEEDIEQIAEMYDGFLFTGGHDVDSCLYGERSISGTVSCSERDVLESRLMSAAFDLDKPVLGICRGIQMINVFLGGTLYQDIDSYHPSEIEHHMTAPYDRECHKVNIIDGSPLHRLLKKKIIGVNSYHHQAINRLASSLSVMAVSEDGITEAVYMKDKKYVWAFQWHPEFLFRCDEDSRMIFRNFIQNCI